MRLHWPDLNIVVAVLRARGRNLTFSYPLFSIKEYTGVSRNAESDENVNADRTTPKGIMGSVSLPLFDRPLLITPCGIVVYTFIGQRFPKQLLLSGKG